MGRYLGLWFRTTFILVLKERFLGEFHKNNQEHDFNFISFRRPSGLWFRTTFILLRQKTIYFHLKNLFLNFMTFVSIHISIMFQISITVMQKIWKGGFVRSHSFILGILSGMAAVGPSVGMTYVDPTPIASHTVSAEAIESEYAI